MKNYVKSDGASEYARIDSKKALEEWINCEKSIYCPHFPNFVFRHLVERDAIWNWQKALRHYEYHLNCHNKIRALLWQTRKEYLSLKYGINIGANVCGKGLHIMHLGSILMNENVRIGENCAVHINTNFVAGGTNSDTPKLGNNLVIGVGATILGGVFLADGIAVGAGAVVNRSFYEEDITIAGVPAKKVSDKGRKGWNPCGGSCP